MRVRLAKNLSITKKLFLNVVQMVYLLLLNNNKKAECKYYRMNNND